MRPAKLHDALRRLPRKSSIHITTRAISTQPKGPLINLIPKGTWDTHMHIIEPTKFPLAPNAAYTPSTHTLAQAKHFLGTTLGVEKMVIVQPSIYGNDNACTLAALRELGPENGRAVVQFDPLQTSAQQLREWHDLGVRGVRMNFKSDGAKIHPTSLAAQLQMYAAAVRPLGWFLDLHIGLEDLPLLEPLLPPDDDVKIVLDHLASPNPTLLASAHRPEDLAGFAALKRLLTTRENVWVKLSATYRLHRDPRNPLLAALAGEVLGLRAERCLWGSDWPHTRFEGTDVVPFVEEILGWMDGVGVGVRERVLVENAEGLLR